MTNLKSNLYKIRDFISFRLIHSGPLATLNRGVMYWGYKAAQLGGLRSMWGATIIGERGTRTQGSYPAIHGFSPYNWHYRSSHALVVHPSHKS